MWKQNAELWFMLAVVLGLFIWFVFYQYIG